MARFKFRKGAVELEIEYPGDVPSDKEDIIKGLLTQFKGMLEGPTEVETTTTTEDPASLKRSNRGGARPAFVSPGIDELIKNKWLAEKTTAEIIAQLKTDGIVGANQDNVSSALLRKVRSRTLTRTQRDGDWVWTIPKL